MSKKLLVSIVGLGHQAIKEYLPIIKNSPFHKLISVCDTNEITSNLISKEFKVRGFCTCDELLDFEKPDLVILSVPHNSYLKIIEKFAERGVHIIKEKPFATSMDEALKIDKIIKKNNVLLGITLQRRFNPLFIEFQKQINSLGKIFLIDGTYGLNIPNLDVGWRANCDIAKGGALLDMGYHFIDLLIWYMGLPNSVTARMSRGNRENQIYDVEDTVNLNFEYINEDYNEKILGHFLISRVLAEKKEQLMIYGMRGNLKIENSKMIISDISNNVINIIEFNNITKRDIVFDQIMFFSNQIKENCIDNSFYEEHFQHISLLEAAYESDKKNISINPFLYYKQFKELN